MRKSLKNVFRNCENQKIKEKFKTLQIKFNILEKLKKC